MDSFAYVGVFVVLWMPNGDCHEISGGGGVAMSIVGMVISMVWTDLCVIVFV